jgi:hypothetical protein
MAQVLLDEVVFTDYGQFDLVWSDEALGFDGVWDHFFQGQVNGLVGSASSDGVYLNLARRSGGSRVVVTLHDAEPPAPTADIEDVVEVPVQILDESELRWTSWAGESGGSLGSLAAGSYRLRVGACGRDAGSADEFADGVVDEYHVDLWPADLAPDAIVRVGSENAAYWHREVGGRR